MSRLSPIVTGSTTCGRHQYGAPLPTVVTLRVAARQRGACFEALYLRQNELSKYHTKQNDADDLQVEKEPRDLSSLYTKT
eukprot:1804064-Pleurochrysis_carterae.AAC.1